jgi:malate dehydrogenase
MKISVIGAGNVGGLTAMRLAQEGVGEIFLIDIATGLSMGKAFDLEDARAIAKYNCSITGSEDIRQVKDSAVVVITAGLTRKPGMTREELLNKNALVLKDVCQNIKALASEAIVVVVTNPLDLMTRFALKCTGFKPPKVLGMGITLDSARFANLIAKELNISPADVDACVMGSHGEGMLPLPRLANIKGVALDEFIEDKKIEDLIQKTVDRGLEIVTLLGSGSAYFAPSAAIAQIVKAIVKDEKRILGVSTYLNGEYGIRDVCIGVPCRLGKDGIEEIVTLDLNAQEREALIKSATKLKEQYNNITV